MTVITVKESKTSIDVYPDQINVTVTLIIENNNEYRIQTDKNGRHSTMLGCLSWLNDDEAFEACDNEEFELAVRKAEEIAKQKLSDLSGLNDEQIKEMDDVEWYR